MHKLAIALSIGAAALFMTVDAKASDTKTADKIAVTGIDASQPTDISSRHRRRHVSYYRGYRQRYAPSYGYYRQPYYQPAPAITFGFGGGGPRYYDGRRGW